MILFYSSRVFKLPWLKKYYAICLGRNIFFKEAQENVSATLHNHEMIHQAQMDQHGVLGFYLKYTWQWFKLMCKYRNLNEAYYRNPFEIEAYAKQHGK